MDLFYNLVEMRQNYVLEINPSFMNVRFLLVCSILAIAPLSGCIGDDDSSGSPSSNCEDDALDSELYGVWLWHTYYDLSIRELHFQADGERTTHRDDPDLTKLAGILMATN